MTNQPPLALIQQWANEKVYDERDWLYEIHIASRAAQWCADQELDECCEYLKSCDAWKPEDVQELFNHRRPKPPSLKKQACDALDTYIYGEPDPRNTETHWLKERTYNTIRKALETLDD